MVAVGQRMRVGVGVDEGPALVVQPRRHRTEEGEASRLRRVGGPEEEKFDEEPKTYVRNLSHFTHPYHDCSLKHDCTG